MSKNQAKPTPGPTCADCNRVIDIDGGEEAYVCERCGKDPICAECGGDDANPGRVVCEDCAVSEETLAQQAVEIYCETGLTPRDLAEQARTLRGAMERIVAYGDANGICPYGCDTPDIARAALAKPEPK